MKILFLGGTRFMGRHAVRALIEKGHDITIATRGKSSDDFGGSVRRAVVDRLNAESVRRLPKANWDVIIDSLAYASNDVRVLLENIDCGKYVFTSSAAVYDRHINIVESDFDPRIGGLIWCARGDFPYDETKRQAERAVFQYYSRVNAAAARFPFAVGLDDYTRRMFFYVEHIINEKPMYIDNIDARMAFARSDEAGALIAFLAESDFTGALNGASQGALSLREILEYTQKISGKRAIIAATGDPAPYNGEREHTINTDKSKSLGFIFSDISAWIYDLLDAYARQVG